MPGLVRLVPGIHGRRVPESWDGRVKPGKDESVWLVFASYHSWLVARLAADLPQKPVRETTLPLFSLFLHEIISAHILWAAEILEFKHEVHKITADQRGG
jgi:hypothetical protein